MATPSGLGVSTGIGKGEAQVFTPVESDYYKNKANLALKEKAAQQEEMKSIGSMPVWNRDLGLFNKKREELIAFSQDNHRSLMEGDYAKKAKFNSMMAGLAQFAASSNAAQKGHLANQAIINKDDTKIYSGSKDEETNFSMDPGNFNVPTLKQNFNSEEFLTDLNNSIANLDPRFKGFNKQNISGTNMLINKSSVDEQDIRSLIDSKTASYSKLYGDDQVQGWIKNSGTDLFKQGEAFAKTGEKAIQESKGNTFNIGLGGKEEENPWAFNNEVTETIANTPYGVDGIKNPENINKISYNPGKINIIGQKAYKDDVKLKIDLPTGFIPLDAAYSSKETKDGKTRKIKGLANRGEFFNIEDSRKSIKSSDTWLIQSSGIYPTYPKGYKTSEKNSSIDISGFPIGQEEIKTPRFKKESPNGISHNFYVKVQNKFKDELLLPFYKAEESLMQKYKTDEQKKYFKQYKKDTREYLIDMNTAEPNSGWDQAYFDFTGKKMPGSGNTSKATSQSPVLPLTQKQLDLAAAFRAKYPEKVEGYTDEQIIQALKK
jgi:hypothetical protein